MTYFIKLTLKPRIVMKKKPPYIPKAGDGVIVDRLNWKRKHDATILWVGKEWIQITSTNGIKTIHKSRITFKETKPQS